MREIKFRAWDIKKCMWVNDFFITLEGDILCSDYLDLNLNDELELMQYTGLKDKNGIEIYEDDILQTVFEGKRMSIFVLEWDLFGLHYYKKRLSDNSRYPAGLDMTMDKEIIGNIYDNPELLEK